jgi:tight adherence protein B
MDSPLLLGIFVFIATVLLIQGGFLGLRALRQRGGERVRRRLQKYVEEHRKDTGADILRRRTMSEMPWFDKLLSGFSRTGRISQLIEQANAPFNVGFYLLLAALLAAVATVGSVTLRLGIPVTVLLALLAATLPFLYLLLRKSARRATFERQFPEALELLARSMRAGHSLPSGMKLVADEFGDPIGPEFARTIEEINFGISIPDALHKLSSRIDCPDLRYFIVAVIIQRETGGNLAEIIEKIASLIRARFVLKGKIRSLSAEGRLSAIVLVGLPIFLAVYLFFFQRQYISTLATDPIGHAMVAGAILMMVTGSVVMHRMVQIKV